MRAMTVSESFRSIINDRKVAHAFFTTYSFEPDFFELEILPVMLGSPSLSSNESIRYYQLQSLMRNDVNRFSVVYDNSVFDPQLAPRLQVDYLRIQLTADVCQHAKIAVVVLNDPKDNVQSVVLCAGSFNLTKAGWWENIEVGHWVEIKRGDAPANILTPLRNALAFFQAKVSTPVLDVIIALLADWKKTIEDPRCSFYFSFNKAGTKHVDFDKFIEENTPKSKSIEIISPFFALNANNKVIRTFLSFYSTAKILLPVDDQGYALVAQKEVYEALSNEQVSWAQWNEKLRSSHLGSGKIYRRLHAKIYQSLGKKPWCFVGSVNFSVQAFRRNVEAGFLLYNPDLISLLDPLCASPEKFKIETEDDVVNDESLIFPVIQAVFNWQDEFFTANCAESGQLSLLNTVGHEILIVQIQADEKSLLNAPELKEYLYRSSILRARWQQENGQVIDGDILVSQRALFCRPNDLPSLDLQSLLRIFIGMHESRRLEMVSDLAIQLLHSSQDDGLHDEFLPELLEHTKSENFFAEFSRVNSAFWELAVQLEQAANNNDLQMLAYYLKGQQPDSLHKVIESVVKGGAEKSSESLITRYITLLSVVDILNRFKKYADNSLLVNVENAISTVEREEIITKIESLKGDRFLTWFKEKFYQSVTDLTRKDRELL